MERTWIPVFHYRTNMDSSIPLPLAQGAATSVPQDGAGRRLTINGPRGCGSKIPGGEVGVELEQPETEGDKPIEQGLMESWRSRRLTATN
jgi:hypothetical protein